MKPLCVEERATVAATQPPNDECTRCDDARTRATALDGMASARLVHAHMRERAGLEVEGGGNAAPGGRAAVQHVGDVVDDERDGDGRDHVEQVCGGGDGSQRARGGGGGADDSGRDMDDGREGDGETGRSLGCGMETAAVIYEVDEDACAISLRSAGGTSLSHGGMGAYVLTGTNIGGGGGCEGDGSSGSEEVTEAEYKRGVKRKRRGATS